MLCERCKQREANVHMVTTVNGVTRESHLCSQCAAQAHAMPQPFSAKQFLGQWMPTQGTHLRCPVCGTTLESLQRTGFVGCPSCYETFAGQLGPMLMAMHGTDRHIADRADRMHGQAASQAVQEEPVQDDPIAGLKVQLQRAVQEERYEDAAQLRDQIKQAQGGQKTCQ